MKFVIESIGKTPRLGYLVQAETGKQFKTPLLLQTTKSGSVPYIGREVFDMLTKDTPVLQMSLATLEPMAQSVALFKKGLAAYVGFHNAPTLLTLRDACESTSGFNGKDAVPLFTRRGKEQITPQRYMDLVESFMPDMYQGLSDADTCADSSKKRVQKSADRTEQFMNYCYERHNKSELLSKKCALFAPIVGGYNTFARSQCINHVKENGEKVCAGYFLEGFHNDGITATELDVAKLTPIVEHCLNELDINKPKCMPGAYTPAVVAQLVKLGIDIFDTSYAYCATNNFKALAFNFDLSQKQALCAQNVFIDLTDESLSEDFTPLLSNCSCLACTKHTRAYLHHLYKTRELLGPILLMLHNLHHYMQYFNIIRDCIAADSMNDLIELIKYQGSDQEVDYRIYKNTKTISKATFSATN